ncbi:protein Skeletor, isoforms B/C-like [Amblyomma americanum]
MATRVFVAALLVCITPKGSAGAYYGKFIGPIKSYAHNFSGNVYAATESSVVVTDLNYDGGGPEAYFKAGRNPELDYNGDRLPDENGSFNVVKPYRKATVHIRLPQKITAYRCVGMFCEKFAADFGNVKIPSDFVLPKEQSLGKLSAKHRSTMATEVVLRDSAIMLLKGFQHDAHCPSASFVAAPTVQPKKEDLTHLIYDGFKRGKLGSLEKTDVTIQLPKGHHWNEFKWFSVYCYDSMESYADITIDKTVAESLPLHDPKSLVAPCVRNSGADIGPLSVLTVPCMAALVAAFAVRRPLVFILE